ncbi:MAG: nucleotidyl transferase AbiEii/AbiGii toxin family protein [Candidatus Binataceae bacterium]
MVLRFARRWNSVCSPVHDRPALLSFACAKGLSSIAFWRALRSLLEDGGSSRAPSLWFRLGGRTRTTKDMDLIRDDSEEAATADLIAAQAVELGDFVTFDIEKVGAPGEDLEGAAMRYRVRAELGGRRFEDVIVDIAFSDPLKWAPEKIAGTDLLEFAGIEPIEVPVLPLEQHIAEKVHAYTRIYSSGRTSSRAKDLVDIVLVKQLMVLDASRLRAALIGVFERRRQHPLPDRLPPPPRDWAVPYRKLASQVSISPELGTGHGEAAALLDPILAGSAEGRWDPKRGRWR